MLVTAHSLQKAALTVALFSSFTMTAFAGDFIIGGTDVAANDPIAMTTVGLYFSGIQGQPADMGAICSGTILDSQTILTAAHCVIGPTKGAVVFNVTFDGVTQADVRPATATKVYSQLSNAASVDAEQEDIATVTFTGGLPAGYHAAQFLSQSQLSVALKAGGNIVLAGYGVTSYDPNNPTGANEPETAGTLRKVSTTIDQVGTSNLYVGDASGTACHGDSGGPAYLTYQGQTYVVGVTSRSDRNDGDCSGDAIYTQFTGLANVHTPDSGTTATPTTKPAKKPRKPKASV